MRAYTVHGCGVSKIREVPFSDWRGAAVASPDGKKIALSAGGHIWLINADGSDFHQLTGRWIHHGEYCRFG